MFSTIFFLLNNDIFVITVKIIYFHLITYISQEYLAVFVPFLGWFFKLLVYICFFYKI